jgi:hypothetical protein
MSWFKKKLKKLTKIADPIGAKLRKSTGGSYGDPMNWYQSKPKAVTPYQRPEKMGLMPDPGTGGPTVNLGGGGNYTPNPFAGQMAQADALRRGPAPTGANVAMPGISNMGSPMGGQLGQPQVGMAPPPQMGMPQQNLQMMQNTMMRPGGRPPGMMF